MTTFNPRNILSISDIHLGNRSTSGTFIIRNLEAFFGHFALKDNFKDLKLIVIAGDLWDDTLVLSADILSDFLIFWYKFVQWCYRQDIELRVLEGTPRHDRNQGETIATYTKIICPNLKFRYVQDLSIEYIESLGLNVLYVPDECRPSAEIVQSEVMELLHQSGLQQVDIAVMHGMFRYQLGSIPMNAKVHEESFFLKIVKHFIVIGHIHSRSFYERIYAQGSFDRLSHNDEVEKGGYYFVEISPNNWEPVFLENKKAMIYRSIEIKGKLDKALLKIDKEVKQLPDGSHVRIVAQKDHEILQAFEELKKKYPFFKFSKKILQEEKEVLIQNEAKSYVPIILNRQTLTQALFSEITLQNELGPEQSKRLYDQLESLHFE